MTGQARPARGVPGVIGDGCVLAKSAAIVASIDEHWPGPVLFPPPAPARDPTAHEGKADVYLADPARRLTSVESSTDALDDIRRRLALGEKAATGEHQSSDPSVIALFPRLASRKAGLVKDDVFGPRLALRIDRMQTLPIVQRTRPLEMSRFA
jgi:hypothetical protein